MENITNNSRKSSGADKIKLFHTVYSHLGMYVFIIQSENHFI